MRKKKGQQGKGEQLRLFPKQEVFLRPSSTKGSGTTSSKRRESAFFSLFTRNRALIETLLEEVMSPVNLNKAYESVRCNGGSSGVDGMDVKGLKEWLKTNGKPP